MFCLFVRQSIGHILDSSSIQLAENNEVIIKQSELYKGKYTDILSKLEAGKLTLKTKTIIKDSILYISRDTNTYNSQTETIKVNELTKPQQTRQTLFWCFIIEHILAIILIIYLILKKFKKKLILN